MNPVTVKTPQTWKQITNSSLPAVSLGLGVAAGAGTSLYGNLKLRSSERTMREILQRNPSVLDQLDPATAQKVSQIVNTPEIDTSIFNENKTGLGEIGRSALFSLPSAAMSLLAGGGVKGALLNAAASTAGNFLGMQGAKRANEALLQSNLANYLKQVDTRSVDPQMLPFQAVQQASFIQPNYPKQQVYPGMVDDVYNSNVLPQQFPWSNLKDRQLLGQRAVRRNLQAPISNMYM